MTTLATVEKRGSTYKITASGGYDRTGKQIRHRITWKPTPSMTVKQIEKELQRQRFLLDEQVAAGVSRDANIRFETFANEWLTDYAEKQLKIKTVEDYKKLLVNINAAIGHVKLKDLKTGHLNSFYSNLQESGVNKLSKKAIAIDLNKHRGKLSMQVLANKAGVSDKTVSAACAGKYIRPDNARKIATALKTDFNKVFKIVADNEKLSPSTVRHYHRCISSILTKAVKWGYIPFNPAANAELPKLETKEAAHLGEQDARQLLTLLQNEPIKYRAAISFDLLSGLRRGELLGLRWCDVSFEDETINIVQTSNYTAGKGIFVDTPKNTTSVRPLKLSRTAFLTLREYRIWQDKQRIACGDMWQDKDGRVFTNELGAPMHPDALTGWFKKFVERTGLPKVSIHSLRHTYASLMIAEGTPLVVVSKRLGHAQVSTTANIYAHVIASADEKAAQIGEQFADIINSKHSEIG